MKCIECSECHEAKITKYPAGNGQPVVKTTYICCKAKRPFEIINVEQSCVVKDNLVLTELNFKKEE